MRAGFMRRGVWSCALVAAAALIGACGGSGDGDTSAELRLPTMVTYEQAVDIGATGRRERGPADVLRAIQLGLAAGRAEEVCQMLTPTGRHELGRLRRGDARACPRVIEEIALRRKRENDRTKISEALDVDRRGRHASVRARNVQNVPNVGKVLDVAFVEHGGQWKLASLVHLDSDAIDNLPGGHEPRFYEPRHYTIPEVLYDVQTDFLRYRGSSVCDDLTAAGEREIELAAGGKSSSCTDTITKILHRLQTEGRQTWSTRVISYQRSGNRATMLVQNIGQPRYRIDLVREEGRWRLPSLAVAEPVAAMLKPGAMASS